jgi:hypothetical protein
VLPTVAYCDVVNPPFLHDKFIIYNAIPKSEFSYFFFLFPPVAFKYPLPSAFSIGVTFELAFPYKPNTLN